MNEIINIEHNNERVLTTDQLAQAYGCETKRISENFNRNVERFEEGQHYFKLGGEALKEFKMTNPQIAEQSLRAPVMYLWTRRGASRHGKMLGTHKDVKFFLQNVLTMKLLHAIIKAYQVKKLHRKKRGGER